MMMKRFKNTGRRQAIGAATLALGAVLTARVSQADIDNMMKRNPARLLGIAE